MPEVKQHQFVSKLLSSESKLTNPILTCSVTVTEPPHYIQKLGYGLI